MRLCKKCGSTKEPTEFHKDTKRKSGLRSWCMTCTNRMNAKYANTPEGKAWSRNYFNTPERRKACRVRQIEYQKTEAGKFFGYWGTVKFKYGITKDQYDKMLSDQGGHCALCDSAPCDTPGKKRLAIDHNHETGEVRGLLCRECNSGLGFFRDNKDRLQKAIDYLSKDKLRRQQKAARTAAKNIPPKVSDV